MGPRSRDNLATLIEEALRSSPVLPVPAGFRERVVQRIRIAALVQEEQRRFRATLNVVVGLILASTALATTLALRIDFPQWTYWSVPGGLGYCDYLSLAAGGWQGGAFGTAATVLLILGGLVFFVYLLRPAPALAGRTRPVGFSE